MWPLFAESVEISDELPIAVVQRDRLPQTGLIDWLATDALQFLDEPMVFCSQEIDAGRGTWIVRQVQEVDIELRKIPLHHKTEIARGITDRTKEDAVKRLEMVLHPHLQRGFYDGADKRSETGVRVLDVEAVPCPAEPHRQHSRGMNDFDWRIDREVADYTGARVLVFPAVNPLEAEVRDQFLALFERSFE